MIKHEGSVLAKHAPQIVRVLIRSDILVYVSVAAQWTKG